MNRFRRRDRRQVMKVMYADEQVFRRLRISQKKELKSGNRKFGKETAYYFDIEDLDGITL